MPRAGPNLPSSCAPGSLIPSLSGGERLSRLPDMVGFSRIEKGCWRRMKTVATEGRTRVSDKVFGGVQQRGRREQRQEHKSEVAHIC